MGRLNTGVLVTTALTIIGALVIGGMQLSALDSRTARNEADIRELRTEIRDALRGLDAKSEMLRELVLATKTAIDKHEARDEERRGR